jgi:hypothetical protein
MTFFRSPLLAGANAIFGVVAGVFAAAFHEDLVNSTPLIWVFRGTDVALNGVNARAASFWGFLLLFSSIWVVREWVAARDRRNEVEQLEALIETVPPPNFLQEFENAFKHIVALLRTAGRESIDFGRCSKIRSWASCGSIADSQRREAVTLKRAARRTRPSCP